jgi:hypothetical protein
MGRLAITESSRKAAQHGKIHGFQRARAWSTDMMKEESDIESCNSTVARCAAKKDDNREGRNCLKLPGKA